MASAISAYEFPKTPAVSFKREGEIDREPDDARAHAALVVSLLDRFVRGAGHAGDYSPPSARLHEIFTNPCDAQDDVDHWEGADPRRGGRLEDGGAPPPLSGARGLRGYDRGRRPG